MRKFDVRWASLIAFIVLLLGWWYWYEYRPNKIREDCAQMVLISLSAFKSDVGGLERDGPIVQKYCEAAGGSEAWTEALKQGQARTER
jgi:hypothetical protein